MAAGNLNLFFRDIAAYLNQLHTVQQRSGDGIQIIGSSDEHHFGQIIVHIQKVIMECSILFRVEHFEEGRGGSPWRSALTLSISSRINTGLEEPAFIRFLIIRPGMAPI